jgi:exodeoxyribonuclease V beta subunit
MTQWLDPLLLPLQGKRLIEASAGTGKTWTIAALYLRLVLGHGCEQTGFGRPLPPENILVVTFTRAATRELSARIRARLAHAARCFQGAAQPEQDDVFLQRLLAAYPSAAARQTAAWRLATAAQAMDEAAVLTIDAWCHRMLREHAFDSGQAFDDVLLADETALKQQAARDVWRQQVYPLSGRDLDAVLALWSDPDALHADVFGSDRAAPDVAPPASATLAELCARLLDEREDALQALKTRYCAAIAAMRGWLLALVQSADCPLNRQTYGLRSVQRWCDALDAWCADPQRSRPELKDDDWDKLTPRHMRSRCVKGRQVDPPAALDAVQALRAELDALPDPEPQMRAYVRAQVRQRLRALKSAAGVSGFADLLERLDSALAAPQGGRLRQRILEQFPVALIDEFQDTSAQQFSVFDRLYAITDAPAPPPLPTAVLLIGDPKQSIYAFRGADIDSYLRARAATAGRHAVLGVNRRSTRELVDAVNRLFDAREQAEGPGAFHYREGGARAANPLPFIPAVAHGRPERLVCAHGAVPAVRFCVSDVPQPKEAVRARFAELAAAAVVELLDDTAAGFVRDDQGGAFTRLRPSDLAVLVRDASEAAAIRRALARRGVASVYLSDKDSVFATREAADLLRWLRAVAAPADGALARAAFATATLGLDLAELAALATDDVVFEQRLALLAELHRVWQRQGVLPMLRQTLHRLNLPARWLAADDGERRLTNVLHLAELLQAASGTLDGEQALIRWLQARLQGAGGEEFTLRLESEADLVRVVTIHKSKGLEYPVVFLPFATACKPSDDRAYERERLREDLRLLYVALTRARHALWIGVAAIQPHPKNCRFDQTAFGYLLAGQSGADAPDLRALLARLYPDQPAVRIDDAPAEAALRRLQRDDAPPALLPARVYDAAFERDWGVSSFSALVRGLAPRSTQDGALLPALQDELPDRDEPPAAVPLLDDAPRHRVARGALAGKFVHEQLAWLAEHRFALDADTALQTRLLQRCARQGWSEAQSHDLLRWLREVLATPLPALGAALPEIDTVLAEMEFWFPVERASAAEIDALCCAYILPGQPRPPLTARALHGMVMGFADLVFAHGGRYWVLDYKSNALGPGDAYYTRQALEAAMLAHRYDVQSALYLLALHRLLRARLGAAYSPQQHLGGAIDWFMRGVRAPGAGCVHIAAEARWLDALDALFASAGEVAA